MDWRAQLRNLRHFHCVKQSVLAERLNVSQATVSRWERGRQVPDVLAQRRIRDLLNQFRKRIDADCNALLSSPFVERSILDTNFVITSASDLAVEKTGVNRSELIGKSATLLRQDPHFERLLNDYSQIIRKGDFICTTGRFFSKLAGRWIETYTIPILLDGRIYFLTDRRTLEPTSFSEVQFTIKLMD